MIFLKYSSIYAKNLLFQRFFQLISFDLKNCHFHRALQFTLCKGQKLRGEIFQFPIGVSIETALHENDKKEKKYSFFFKLNAHKMSCMSNFGQLWQYIELFHCKSWIKLLHNI